MRPERWQRVKDLLSAALETDPAARSAFLDQACGCDVTLRAEVEDLLAAGKTDGQPLSFPPPAGGLAPSARDTNARIGSRIGPYQIIEEIGAGGMGEVYRAFRADDQYRMEVAIKLVRAGLDSGFVVGRFKHERQLLAGLDHPNIARLLDGGTTEEGNPYFVMELIEGQPITEHCDRQKLATTERLRLFLQVCSAVQYAHQHLIIHRDLKPGNILVTSDGTPKLLDFGIAKLLDPASSEGPEATISIFRLLTPAYASPEQIKGEPVTTASDVYSLGVLLYELLTGRRPYRISSQSPRDIERAVCELEPERPSTALRRSDTREASAPPDTAISISEVRDGSPEKLARRLRGDLDNITLKALRKETRLRYSSVEQFATDIRRHLENLPVHASAGTLRYRTSKFVRRHKAGLAATTVVALAVFAGLAATLHEASVARRQEKRAEQRFNDVRKLADSFMFDFDKAIQDIPGTTRAREMLVKTALEYLDSLSRESAGDASLQRELATAYENVGEIQGALMQQNIGNTSGALESYRKALAIRKSLVEADPGNRASRLNLAVTYGGLGLLLGQQNDFAGALEADHHATAIYEALAAESPSDFEAKRNQAGGYEQLAFELSLRGDFAESVKYHRQAIAIYEQLATTQPGNQRVATALAHAYRLIAYSMRNAGDNRGALDMARKAIPITQRLLENSPNNVRAKLDLVAGYEQVGSTLETMGDQHEALENWQKALDLSESAMKADPNDARAKIMLGDSAAEANLIAIRLGSATGVEGLLKSLEVRQQLLSANPNNRGRKEEVAKSDELLGDGEVSLASSRKISQAAKTEHWRNAESFYKRALEIFEALQAQGALRGENAGHPESIRQAIAKCDAALARNP